MTRALIRRRDEDAEPEASTEQTELNGERERLTERFALMQSELGGLFYEMAIRDHVNMELLIERAAAMQLVEAELAHVEHLKRGGDAVLGGRCGHCAAPYARGAAYCAQCGQPLG